MSAPEIYRNAQWVVTEDGLETTDGTYFIARDRLLKMRDGTYEWPLHLAVKSWVNMRAFVIAFDVALRRLTDGHDEAMMADCIERVYDRLMRSMRFAVMHERLFPTTPGDPISVISFCELAAVADAVRAEASRLAQQSVSSRAA